MISRLAEARRAVVIRPIYCLRRPEIEPLVGIAPTEN